MPDPFRLTDSTLRDGSHALRHQLTEEQVRAVVRGLDAAGVPVIEVSHGDGLGGSSISYGFSATDEMTLVRAAVEEAKTARIAVLLLPGIGTKTDLVRAAELGASVARIATHCTEADVSRQHITLAKGHGMEVVGFLMMSHMIAPEALLDQAREMESYGADVLYVVDSAGAMIPSDVSQRVAVLQEGLEVAVGIHAHNNLGLAVANSLAGLAEGAGHVDGCLTGLGAGAGNCPTEVLVAAAERAGYQSGLQLADLLSAAEHVVRPLRPQQGVIDADALLLGYAGVYGSFLLHAKKAAEQYGVNSHDIIMELGRRRVVGGQEDMIIDVALALQGREGR